jgi:pantoate--beta-alanine ligase
MQVFTEIYPLRSYLGAWRKPEFSIGLVPTMGALHEGHLSLIEACKPENDLTIASIFVNPTQFNNADDLAQYPRTVSRDLVLLEAAGCDIVFIPAAEEIYPQAPRLSFQFAGLDDRFEGAYRPGHFNGVGLVVAKLFHIIGPQRAYFGQKDFQQYLVISRLVEDLSFPIEVIACPTVREPDGLAMSSRNQRLNPQQRQAAGALYQALQSCREQLLAGQPWPQVSHHAQDAICRAGLKPEYLALADAENLNPMAGVEAGKPAVVLAAAYAGDVRLIDNLFVQQP